MIHTQDPNTLLDDLDLMNQTINTTQACLNNLLNTRASIIRKLDAITSPVQPCTPTRKSISRGYDYQGEHTPGRSFIGIYLGVLRRLLTDFQDKRETIANAMARSARNRRYIAQDPVALFKGKPKPPEWISKYSVELVHGWYADKNLSADHIKSLLQIAVRAAGLRWKKDVKVYWQ
ncbi:MAG: hypothetical protein FWD64_12390 [Acidobacteriaceae bacterium]|nr:hypothetical protein [Acidobacteriaceae bacterium]